MITLMPPRVGNVGLLFVIPVVTGITLVTLPLRVTVRVCFAMSTVLIWRAPMLNADVTVRRPQTPGENSTPPTAAVTFTLVPAGQ